ncbi:heavy metal-associated isoprenylated plant protein 47-like [Pyrus communis]|uniref:heavy metal-associated isoprenylated plant protein 47-like n=1 Tax=Pyrus communis TaxID=23211 RepID=UPI0035BF1A97
MQQKILVKVQMHSDKCRTKALKIAAAAYGVSKVSLEGENKDHLEVTGDGFDGVCLAKSLKKKLGFTTVVSIEEVKKPEEKLAEPIQLASSYIHYSQYPAVQYHYDRFCRY